MKDAKEEKLPEQIQDPFDKAKVRILSLILERQPYMVNDYKHVVKHTGGLLQKSMGMAYEKGIQDTFKLIAKEAKTEDTRREDELSVPHAAEAAPGDQGGVPEEDGTYGAGGDADSSSDETVD